jgi:rubrerythrin
LEAAPNTAHPFPRGLEPRSNLEYYTNELERLRVASEAVASARHALHAHRDANTQPPQTLDNQSDRPAPKSDEEMTKVLACQVCYQQVADIALLPCGHMVMCQWCADIVIPVKHTHLPIRPSNCPMCRKQVKQRFRIHTG